MIVLFRFRNFTSINSETIKGINKGYVLTSNAIKNLFIIYPINGLIETPQGYKVLQIEKLVYFGKIIDEKLNIKEFSGIQELFIPNYLLERNFFMHSEDLEAEKNPSLDLEMIVKKGADINNITNEINTEKLRLIFNNIEEIIKNNRILSKFIK